MKRRQLTLLFACSLVGWLAGGGLLPLLPVYAMRFGAVHTTVGAYLAFSYLALAAGTIVAGWISDRTQRRKVWLIAAGAVGMPALWLMGQVTTIGQLGALTAIAWFVGGMGLTLLSILAGLGAESAKRGRVFGILAMTNGFGALLGGVTIGPMVEQWGYATMFAALSLSLSVWIIAGVCWMTVGGCDNTQPNGAHPRTAAAGPQLL